MNISFKNWRFLQLAVFIMLLSFLSPLFPHNWATPILTQLFLLNSMLVAFSASNNNTVTRRALWIIWGTAAFASSLEFFTISRGLQTITLSVGALLLIFCVVSIISFVFRSRMFTVDSIFAAFVAYLLIAFVFANVYTMIMLWNPQSFKFPFAYDLNLTNIRNNMTYFSLVTVATLGYGDIFPVSKLARITSVFEAILGQFYVAVVVALLVGIFISKKHTSQF